MTSPQIMKYWRKNIKNKYLILFGIYLILFELGKIRFLKISFWAQINVHLVRLIFSGRRKFISGFLESVQYLFSYFFCTSELLKKHAQAQLDRSPAPAHLAPRRRLLAGLRRRRRRQGVRLGLSSASVLRTAAHAREATAKRAGWASTQLGPKLFFK